MKTHLKTFTIFLVSIGLMIGWLACLKYYFEQTMIVMGYMLLIGLSLVLYGIIYGDVRDAETEKTNDTEENE